MRDAMRRFGWVVAAAMACGPAAAETITGTVTVQPGGAPLANASIQIGVAGSEASIAFATSGADGRYTVTVPALSLRARAAAAGFQNLVFPSAYCLGPCPFALGNLIPVAPGATVSNIDFAMRALPLANVNGTVTDAPGGFALAGVAVRATQYLDPVANVQVERNTTSNGAGQYSLQVIAGVPFRIGGFPSDGRIIEMFPETACFPACELTNTALGTVLTLVEGQVRNGTDFTLSFPGTASGIVTRSTPAGAIADAELEFTGDAGHVGRATTTASGGYSISLPPDTYRVTTANPRGHFREQWDNRPCTFGCAPASGDPVVVAAAQATSGIDFVLVLGGSISGSAGPSQSSLDVPDVEIYDAAGVLVDRPNRGDPGMFSFRSALGLPTGNYFVRTNAVGAASYMIDSLWQGFACEPGCDPTSGTPVPVVSGTNTPGINFSLAFGCTVIGLVREEGTQQGITDAGIQVYASNGALIRDEATVNPNGVYLANFGSPVDAAATYFVKATSARHVDELYDGTACEAGCTVTLGTPVTCNITSTTPASVDFLLTAIDLILVNGFE